MTDEKKLLLSASVLLLESLRENRSFRVSRTVMKNASATGRLVFVSDLHGRRDTKAILRAIRILKPDLILSGGDLLTAEEHKSHQEAKKFVRALVKIAPLYAANGNHEKRMQNFSSYTDFIKSQGACYLSQTQRRVPLKTGAIQLSAVEIPQTYYRLFERRTISAREIEKQIGKADAEDFHVMLMHNPAHYAAGIAYGADLILGGHMHGGIVSLPFGRGLISPQARLFPRNAWGHRKYRGAHVITSRGLGAHTVRVRLFNSPEIVVIDLVKQEKGCSFLPHNL